MNEHDEARRAFLIGSALGVGAVAGSALPAEAAPTPEPAAVPSTAPQVAASSDRRGAFLNDDERSTVAAIAERIMPGAPGMAGATDADVINYIDLALAGAYADQQEFYRHGLAALDAFCTATYKDSFAYLKAAQQDEALRALESGKATGFTYPSATAFFNVLRTHVMEGMFADPIYGGNKDFAGWRLVGFPGAQRLYTTADLNSREVFTRQPIMGLQSIEKTPAGRK